MKRFIAIFLALLSFSVSAKEAFDCEGWGFTIDGKKAAYGPTELVLCSTTGNWLFFAQPNECKLEKKYNISFDKITFRASIMSYTDPTSATGSSMQFVNCKKVKL
jgi:hypothetical protein